MPMPPFSWPPSPRGLNVFTNDGNLSRFLTRIAPQLLEREADRLTRFGAFCGHELDAQAELSDRIYPPHLVHEVADPIHPGLRKGRVALNTDYRAAQQRLYREGFLAQCFQPQDRQPHLLPLLAQYLACKSDIATGCPFAMSHPVALLISRSAPEIRNRFLPEMIRMDGLTPVGGTWATEKHGGSDVSATQTVAVSQADGTVRLHGDNWFTSAIGFDRFLTVKTARPEGAPAGGKGLGLYLVPSHVDRNWTIPNHYEILHLKEKVGTRGLPTGEIRLDGALAYPLAGAGSGLRLMMDALGCSRVHNAMAAAGAMHRALMEALCWTVNRETFGAPLATRPMIVKRVLDIQMQWLAGSALAFEAARSFSATVAGGEEGPWLRIVTALAKYLTAEQAIWCTRKALELVGGNGYTEDYGTVRQFRDAQVLAIWEGPEQIQALELARILASPDAVDTLLQHLSAIAESLRRSAFPAIADRLVVEAGEIGAALAHLARDPARMEMAADELLAFISRRVAFALMCDEGLWEMENYRDRTKMLFAERYYERGIAMDPRPSGDRDVLHDRFGDVAAGRAL